MKKVVTNSRIGNAYKKDGTEMFSLSKFKKGMLSFLNPVEWAKDIYGMFNVRKLTIWLVIIALIFAYGFWKGKGDRPIDLNIGRYQEVVIRLNGEQLHIYKNGEVWVEEYKTGKKIKQIKVKDVPFLNDKLKPIKLKLRPIFVAGGSTNVYGENTGELGVGLSFLEVWKLSLEGFITSNPAIYGGISYSITDNAGIGLGIGKNIENFDTRAIIYGRIRF